MLLLLAAVTDIKIHTDRCHSSALLMLLNLEQLNDIEMQIIRIGFYAYLASFIALCGFGIVQIMQVLGIFLSQGLSMITSFRNLSHGF